MPSENGGKRNGAPPRSARSQATDPTTTGSDSLSSTPPAREKEQHQHKPKSKHAVGGHRMHTRVPSTRALQKLKPDSSSKAAHRRQPSAPVSPTTTSPTKRDVYSPNLSPSAPAPPPPHLLKPAGPHAHLRRNRSHVEVKKARPTGGMRRTASHTSVAAHKAAAAGRSSVHFDASAAAEHDDHDDGDGWTEASGSASPNLSRAGSVGGVSSGRSSAKPPASAAPSAAPSPSKPSASRRRASPHRAPAPAPPVASTGPDAHQITSRLLQRVPSHSGAAPKISSVSATAATAATSDNSGAASSGPATPRADAAELISRFKGSGSGTPGSGDASPFLAAAAHSRPATARAAHELHSRRAKSMSNLAAGQAPPAAADDSDEERALAPRSRKASASGPPPEQSRTQQKLWLQRASSHMEPAAAAQLAPAGALGLGLGGVQGGLGMGMGGTGSALVGAGFGGLEGGLGLGGGGGDPRVRVQLERTGQAYLAVRRYQDPVARGLGRLPGGEGKRIPGVGGRKVGGGGGGLSQSLKESRGRGSVETGGRSFEGAGAASARGSGVSEALTQGGLGDEGLAALLRGLWERGGEMAGSAE